jgi:hypothetical protein
MKWLMGFIGAEDVVVAADGCLKRAVSCVPIVLYRGYDITRFLKISKC